MLNRSPLCGAQVRFLHFPPAIRLRTDYESERPLAWPGTCRNECSLECTRNGAPTILAFPLGVIQGGADCRSVGDICGCSSMAEHQPSKLGMWVQFPSLAPFFYLYFRQMSMRGGVRNGVWILCGIVGAGVFVGCGGTLVCGERTQRAAAYAGNRCAGCSKGNPGASDGAETGNQCVER